MDITPQTSDSKYLDKMRKKIPKALDAFKPEFVVYNAGTDIMEGDERGELSVRSH